MTKSAIVGFGLVLVFLLIFLGELFLFTWSRVDCIRTAGAIADASQAYKNELALQKKLTIELAHLKSPERLATIATKEFGLAMPKPEQIISLK